MTRHNTQGTEGPHPHGPAEDERIRAQVVRLAAEQLACGTVTVSVAAACVTLAGTVTDLHGKQAMENLARSVEGVQQVENRIAVRGTC